MWSPPRPQRRPCRSRRSGRAARLACAALAAVPVISRAAVISWTAVISLTALSPAAPAHAGPRDPLYQWSDASGAVRYTTNPEQIPQAFRESAMRVEAGRAAEENAARLPGARTEPDRPVPAEEWLEGGLEDDARLPAPSPVEAAPDDAHSALDARIAQLEAAVERDETALEELVSDPGSAARLRESDALDTIAERLPRLQRELRELRARREALAGPDGD